METLWKLQIQMEKHDPVQQKATPRVLHRYRFFGGMCKVHSLVPNKAHGQ